MAEQYASLQNIKQYTGLHIYTGSIVQECQIIKKVQKISKHAYISPQRLILIMVVII